jgi:hypothetical protein
MTREQAKEQARAALEKIIAGAKELAAIEAAIGTPAGSDLRERVATKRRPRKGTRSAP